MTVRVEWMIVATGLVIAERDPLLAQYHTLPTSPMSAPCPQPPCQSTSWRVEYVDRGVDVWQWRTQPIVRKVPESTLELKENAQPITCMTWELRPREIVKDVICITVKPVRKTDPTTGCEVIVLESVREKKQITETRYVLCPVESQETLRTFSLKPKTETVEQTRLMLEAFTERERHTRALLLPTICTESVVKDTPDPCRPQPSP